MSKFKVGDLVFYDENPLKIIGGPFRTDDYPTINQYECQDLVHNWTGTSWESDLMSEDEYLDFLEELLEN